MIWTNDFISRALDGLPNDKYRQRAQAELTDHLLELAEELEAGGYSPEEAQAKATSLMGDPAQLNPSFREEWIRRASNWRYCMCATLKSAIHGVMFNLLFRSFVVTPLIFLIPGPPYKLVQFNSLLYAILFALFGFLPGLWFTSREMNERFSIHPRRKILITLSLLSVWLPDASWLLFDSGFAFLDSYLSLFFSVMILGQYSLLLLLLNSMKAYGLFCLLSLILCLLVALFYRPKGNNPFLLSDKT